MFLIHNQKLPLPHHNPGRYPCETERPTSNGFNGAIGFCWSNGLRPRSRVGIVGTTGCGKCGPHREKEGMHMGIFLRNCGGKILYIIHKL